MASGKLRWGRLAVRGPQSPGLVCSGPRSRLLLQVLDPELELADLAFPPPSANASSLKMQVGVTAAPVRGGGPTLSLQPLLRSAATDGQRAGPTKHPVQPPLLGRWQGAAGGGCVCESSRGLCGSGCRHWVLEESPWLCVKEGWRGRRGQRCLGGLGMAWIGVFGAQRWNLGWVEGCRMLGLGWACGLELTRTHLCPRTRNCVPSFYGSLLSSCRAIVGVCTWSASTRSLSSAFIRWATGGGGVEAGRKSVLRD